MAKTERGHRAVRAESLNVIHMNHT